MRIHTLACTHTYVCTYMKKKQENIHSYCHLLLTAIRIYFIVALLLNIILKKINFLKTYIRILYINIFDIVYNMLYQ